MRLSTLALVFALAACGGVSHHDHDGPSNHKRHDGLTSVGDHGELRFELEWRQGPALGRNVLAVMLTDADSAPVTDAHLEVEPFMLAHGHGSSTTPVVSTQGDGIYLVQELVFTMSGEWHVTLDARTETLDDSSTFVVVVQ